MPSEGSDGIGLAPARERFAGLAIGKRKPHWQVCRFDKTPRCRVGRAAL
ncbi:hypothetical protein ACR30T_01180 [Neisseria gonorrhoeae]